VAEDVVHVRWLGEHGDGCFLGRGEDSWLAELGEGFPIGIDV
jgi:hypothetical protein